MLRRRDYVRSFGPADAVPRTDSSILLRRGRAERDAATALTSDLRDSRNFTLARNPRKHCRTALVGNSLLIFIDRIKPKGFSSAVYHFDQSLDPAVWRRFDEVIWFERPDRR